MIYYIAIIIVIQLFFEVLPFSSSSHTALFECFVKARYAIRLDSGLRDMLDHALLGVTLFVLALFFYSRWSIFLRAANPFFSMPWHYRKKIIVSVFRLGFPIACASLLTAVFYGIFRSFLNSYITEYAQYLRVGGLFLTALMLFLLSFSHGKKRPFDIQIALFLGIVQGVSLLPGISRFASTYCVGYFLGLGKRKSFEVSWLLYSALAVPSLVVGVAGLQRTIGLFYFCDMRIVIALVGGGVLSFYALSMIKKILDSAYAYLLGFYMFFPIVATFLLCY